MVGPDVSRLRLDPRERQQGRGKRGAASQDHRTYNRITGADAWFNAVRKKGKQTARWETKGAEAPEQQ